MSDNFQNESPETRFALYQIIERAVRPLRATPAYKRKIREELLAHLIAIYTEEKQTDPAAAVAKTARRFGDPAELTRELAAAIPRSARGNFQIERFLAWRPPESGTHYAFRLALRLFVVSLIALGIAMTINLLIYGYSSALVTLRCCAGLVLGMPLMQFFSLFLYFKIRDHIFGVFGSPKSPLRVAFYSFLCIVLVVPLAGIDALVNWNLYSARQCFALVLVVGFAAAVLMPIVARLNGPKELDETFWATLPI